MHKNEEIYIVMCNSHLDFSKSTKIYHLENLYAYGKCSGITYKRYDFSD